MRRKIRFVPHGRRKAAIYTLSLITLLTFGIPRIPELHPGTAGTFAMVWIMFSALAVAANLYFWIGADKERSRMLEEQGAPEGAVGPVESRKTSLRGH